MKDLIISILIILIGYKLLVLGSYFYTFILNHYYLMIPILAIIIFKIIMYFVDNLN
jgi:hypothetical protein